MVLGEGGAPETSPRSSCSALRRCQLPSSDVLPTISTFDTLGAVLTVNVTCMLNIASSSDLTVSIRLMLARQFILAGCCRLRN